MSVPSLELDVEQRTRETLTADSIAGRNAAVDAYRGLVMLLMMAEVLQFSRVAEAYPTSLFWKFLAFHQTHVEWFGCSLHDTIQPGFSFLVGVALPYSIASRIAKGALFPQLFVHTLWRSVVLVALGVFLRSMDHSMTYFTFEDTLSQIGLGYPFLFVLGFFCSKPARVKWIWAALAFFSWPIGWRGRCILRPPRNLIGKAWGYPQRGTRNTISQALPHTGTRITISETASTSGT